MMLCRVELYGLVFKQREAVVSAKSDEKLARASLSSYLRSIIASITSLNSGRLISAHQSYPKGTCARPLDLLRRNLRC